MKASYDQTLESAREIGFDAIGIIPAESVSDTQARAFENYLSCGRQAGMDYLARNREKRYDPRLLLPGARSIVAVLYGYAPRPEWPVNRRIALYAQGKDYHPVIREKLFRLSRSLPDETFRCFCDTAPVLEKYWAAKAGLGFIGRNTLLIHPRLGSYCLIGILLCQSEFDRYSAVKDREGFYPENGDDRHPCHRCRLCIDSCPGGALGGNPEGSLDSRLCFSYLTIENKGERPPIPTPYWFGCDICQKVCPANRDAGNRSPGHEEFRATDSVLGLEAENLIRMQNEELQQHIPESSALNRAGSEGLRKNAVAWKTAHPSTDRTIP